MKNFCLFFIVMFSIINLSYANSVIPITNFDSSQYLGTWYEIARLPNNFENNCSIPIFAKYSINPDNSNQLIVVNQCNNIDQKPDIAYGMAYFVESSNIGKLEVTFLPRWLRWLPFGYGDYWIISTDYKKVAVIASPDHKYLWILARSKDISNDLLKKALIIAEDQGFDITKLIFNYAKPITTQPKIEQKTEKIEIKS